MSVNNQHQQNHEQERRADPDVAAAAGLIDELSALRADLLRQEEALAARGGFPPGCEASARNLVHYMALRNHDIRGLQDRLAALGLSSLGRAESCVLATVNAVLRVLHRLAGRPWRAEDDRPALGVAEGKALLAGRTAALLGAPAAEQPVHIMVTMPGEATDDYPLVRDLLAHGMTCARINCAHDDAPAWERMVGHLRRAEAEVGRSCRILMDLGGPKLRTGPLALGPKVVKCKPQRDARGRPVKPARVLLTAEPSTPAPPEVGACLPVPREWLAALRPGDTVTLKDARGSRCELVVVAVRGDGCLAETSRTVYFLTGTVLKRTGKRRGAPRKAAVGELPAVVAPLALRTGDRLILTREQRPGAPAKGREPAAVACTLPEVFADVKPGQRVLLDDGKIGGVIRAASPERVEVEVTQTPPGLGKLGPDKGVCFPDSELRFSSLTPRDLEDLPFVAAHADLVGFSFVRTAADVAQLRTRLAQLGAREPGVVLKIETRRGFENLPHLLLEGLRGGGVAVMIARGDLAVECGYERLAELQEEILWVCEAAHVPVIWATQVLEGLAKEGMPSRAEITDAAMSERAECVMLNKGPHIRDAVRMLGRILRRMRGHQSKKRSTLRRLHLADRFLDATT
jgi:pyruvate kinase